MRYALFLIYLFVEVYVSFAVASSIGAFATFLEIVISAIFGFFILFNAPIRVNEVMQNFANQSLLAKFTLSSILRIFSAIFLILPGLFGDLLGVILLLGSIILALQIKLKAEKFKRRDHNNNEEIIDVEIIDNNHNE